MSENLAVGATHASPLPMIRSYRVLLDTLWIIVLAIYVLAGTLLVPFHGDESTLLSLTRDYANLFILNLPERVRFNDTPYDPGAQYLRLINGSLNIYGMGLAWQVAGFSVNDINDQWDWGAGWDYNQQNNHAPTPELLAATRWPGALFTAAGVAAMFALGMALDGRLTAYLASLYYALNPAILLNGRRATLEGSTIFFGLFVVLAGLWLLRHRTWWTAIALGIVSGLALASKHTNLFAVGAVFAACALYPVLLRTEHRNLMRYAAQVTFAGILTILTFYALNPVWWDGNALERGLLILRLRQDLLQDQVSIFGG
ncbi:MAG: phospholipid carrier-dependent glycosyltransferase, partial [Burkholderiales bacterium]|nr:phospholipid carrier-dependent glycosyltransferase [Anaerolineae bacterium]